MARRRVVSLVAGGLLALAAALVSTSGAVLATAPVKHEVDICHATPPDTAANGYQLLTVDVASVGYQSSGHQDEHAADIIPPWSYVDDQQVTHSYAGKNWDAEGQAIWENDCVDPNATPTPTATICAVEDVFPGVAQTAAPCETPTATPTATAFESFQGETGTPIITAPPTNTGGSGSSDSSLPLFALLISFAFGGLGITAVEAQRRGIRR